MPQYDLPPDQLRAYRPELAEPGDLEEFWTRTLRQARSHPLSAEFVAVENQLAVVNSYDLSFAGYGGTTVRGWLHLPAGHQEPLPAVVQYIGYGGGRGLVHENLLWAVAGYAHLVVDVRGQGSGWSVGDTPDEHADAGSPAVPGFMTRGILDPETYYYRRVFTDAVRAVEAVRTLPAVDAGRVAVTGGSQGGGIALAVAGLVPDLMAVLPDVPFLCDFPRATVLVDSNPYAEIALYLKAHRDHVTRVFDTLAYFDGAILGRRATAPALFSVALMDRICPPSTVYAAYNYYAGDKDIRIYPYNDHEGGQGFHDIEKLQWLSQMLKR
jgi:cephalosporin-C deacetylase